MGVGGNFYQSLTNSNLLKSNDVDCSEIEIEGI